MSRTAKFKNGSAGSLNALRISLINLSQDMARVN